MKYLKKISYLASLALLMPLAISCSSDDEYEPAAPVSSDVAGLYFTIDSESEELDPENPTVKTITVSRMESSKAATYTIKVVENTDDAFVVPETVSFAAGDSIASFDVSFPNTTVGTAYTLKVSFEDADINPYKYYQQYAYSVTRVKWDNIGTGYWIDGNITRFWGAPAVPLAVEIQKNEASDGSVKYRFNSPFAYLATAVDEYGGYNGYPYNEAGDCDEQEHKFIITVTKDGASLAPVEIGMDWGYGMISFGQIYPYVSSKVATYPLGTYSEADGVIAFPANSLYISMSEYNSGSAYPAKSPSYLYLSGEAYANSLEEGE